MILALVLLACDQPIRGGTAVGNPGPNKLADGALAFELRDVPADVALDQALLAVADVALGGCGEDGAIVAVDAEVDALAGEAVALPGGSWCGLEVSLGEGGLSLGGETAGGVRFTLGLDPGVLEEGSSVLVDGGEAALELSLAGAIDAAAIEAAGEPEVTIPSDDPRAVAWAEALAGGVALGEEQPSGAPAYDAQEAEGGRCDGCGGGGAGGGGLLALAGLLARRRARPARRPR